jgi:hypothetical protein
MLVWLDGVLITFEEVHFCLCFYGGLSVFFRSRFVFLEDFKTQDYSL